MQADNIIEKARRLGIDTGSSINQSDMLRHIADQLGVEDLAELEETLDSMLADEVETLEEPEEIETLDAPAEEQPTKKERFGEREYNQARDDSGKYDKNYYANRGKELDDNLEKAKQEQAKKTKDVIKKNDQGEQITTQKNKNVFDRMKDNANVRKIQNDRFANKVNSAKSKAFNLMHPGEALKDKAKSALSTAGKEAGKNVAKGAAKAGQAAGKIVAKGVKSLVSTMIKLIATHPIPALIIGSILILFFILIVFFYGTTADNDVYGLFGYDYVESRCAQITISGGEYAGVYDIEEYIAGVTFGEFGVFIGNEWNEAAKAGAVAARSFVQANVGEDCTVISSESFQVYRTPSEGAIQIANETRGLVLTNSSGNIISTQYDAFCTDYPQDDPNNYIVCQQNQKIPRSWVDSQPGIKDSWKAGERNGAHGNGMSAWGAAYLAEQGYNFEEILEFYYGDTASEIKSIFKSYGYSGEYPITPDDELYANLSFLINQSFPDFLASRGTSQADFDAYLTKKINEAGVGTREGVVSAAVTLIGSLADLGVKLNYQWGGKYAQIGTNANWGSEANMSWLCDNYADAGYDKSVCTNNYKWHSFDCSGFVNWALVNGMQDTVATQYTSTSGGKALSSSTAVCDPGGTLVSEGHIVLVVGIDDANKRYIVAESTGSRLATGVGGVKLSYYSYGASGYVCKNLDELYGD